MTSMVKFKFQSVVSLLINSFRPFPSPPIASVTKDVFTRKHEPKLDIKEHIFLFCWKNTVCLQMVRSPLTSLSITGGVSLHFTFNPNQFIKPFIKHFKLFQSLPVHLSFACRHIVCLILLKVARYAFKRISRQDAGKQTKSALVRTTELGQMTGLELIICTHIAISPTR